MHTDVSDLPMATGRHAAPQDARNERRCHRRFVVITVCLAIVVALPLGCTLVPPASTLDRPAVLLVVRNGDTLWSIALAHPIAHLSTRDVVEWIRDRNGLDSACIKVGDLLEVPAPLDAVTRACE